MGKCEQIRQMLVELEYGELEPMDARRVEAHLRDCDACARRQVAYRAVRADLRTWDEAESLPARVTFVAMPPGTRRSGWMRPLGMAASFLLGFLVVAAFANLEISRGDDGWALRTSLLPRAPAGAGAVAVSDVGEAASAEPASAGPVAQAGGTQPRVGIPVAHDDGMRVVSQEEIEPLLEELITEREARLRALMREMLAAAENRQRQEIDAALSGLFQTFDVQRTNDLLFLANEMGLLQENTGQELRRTQAAIDYLITRAALQRPQEDQP